MSGYFDGRNGRLSKTWRFRRSGKSVKTLGDLRGSAGTGVVAVLPFYLAVYEEFLISYLEPSRGAVWDTRFAIMSCTKRGLVYI